MRFGNIKKLIKSTSAKLTTSSVTSIVLTVVIILVLFQAYATIIPEAQEAGDSINTSNRCESAGCYFNTTDNAVTSADCRNDSTISAINCAGENQSIPLSGLFSSSGVIFVLIMAMLLVLVVRNVMVKKK